MFGRAAITLGIGPHSSSHCLGDLTNSKFIRDSDLFLIMTAVLMCVCCACDVAVEV